MFVSDNCGTSSMFAMLKGGNIYMLHYIQVTFGIVHKAC